MKDNEKIEITEKAVIEKKKIKCGIIMPISPIDGCPATHWEEVKSIFTEATSAITEYEVVTSIVSEAQHIGVIQKRIVQNIYNSDIVICDVSGKNPNVMFELGMRLAFDKPTIIVKDDITDYIFDTGVIEHLKYPRDLRFSKIIEFKEILKEKFVATLKSTNNTTFLKSFGDFEVVKLDEKDVTISESILNSIEELKEDISLIKAENRIRISQNKRNTTKFINQILDEKYDIKSSDIRKELNKNNKYTFYSNSKLGENIEYIPEEYK